MEEFARGETLQHGCFVREVPSKLSCCSKAEGWFWKVISALAHYDAKHRGGYKPSRCFFREVKTHLSPEKSNGMKSSRWCRKILKKSKANARCRRQKGSTKLSPAPAIFWNRAWTPERQAVYLALRRDIQAVVLQQSKDQPNQFSGS